MDNHTSRRIVKNTLALYIRMFFVMGIGFITTRVVINVLGLEDFGIYSVVASCVIMFSFITGMLASSTQRFISYAIGQDNYTQIRKIYSISLILHLIFGLTIIILAETVGLYFVTTRLSIPPEKVEAALWVYQFSIGVMVVGLFHSMFLAIILAHEKMEVYTYISVLEAVLKLGIIFLLTFANFDKLKMYGFLLFATSSLICLTYYVFCRYKFKGCRFTPIKDKKLFTSVLGFSGWNLFGCLATVCSVQGISILLNMFMGPLINAAMAVTFQISGAVTSFVNNYQASVAPQIVKTYSSEDMEGMRHLLYQSSKYGYCLLWFLVLPLFLEMDYILLLWLKNVPEYTASFSRLILVRCLIYSLNRPFVMAIHATGNMWQTNTTGGLVLLSLIPLSYFFLKKGFSPEISFILYIITSLICFIIEFMFLHKWIGVSLRRTLSRIILPVLIISIISLGATLPLVYFCIPGLVRLGIVSMTSFLVSAACIYRIGLDKETRIFVKERLKIISARIFLHAIC